MSLVRSVTEIVRRAFPELFYRGIFRCRVVSAADGKVTVTPVASKLFGPHDRIDVWGGIGGYGVIPRVDSEVFVAFADANPGFPIIVGFEPRGRSRPLRSEIDADEIRLGDANDGAPAAVHRVGDRGSAGTWTALGASLIYTSPFGLSDGQWGITGSTPSGPVTWTLVPSTGTVGAAVSKATTGAGRTKS